MFKIFLKFFSSLLILLGLVIGYLSFFGIETKSFNKLIQEEISRSNESVIAKFDKVKILLNISNLSANIKASNVALLYNDKKIQLKNISTNFALGAFLKKEFGIKNISVESKDNNLKDVINFVRIYKNSPQLIIFEKMLKGGSINTKIELNFNKDGKIKDNYKVKGLIEGVEIRLLNKDIISNIDLNFNVQKKLYLIKNGNIKYKGIKFSSDEIKIVDQNKHFLISGNIKNKTSNLDSEKLSIFFKHSLENLNFKNTKLSSDNNFSFKINKKLKISDFSSKSKIKIDKLNYKIDHGNLKKYFPSFNESLDFENHEITLLVSKKKFSVQGEGNYLIDAEPEKINYNIINNDGNLKFKSKININKNPLNIEFLN